MVVGFVGEWMALLYEYDILLLYCATAVLYEVHTVVHGGFAGCWCVDGLWVRGWVARWMTSTGPARGVDGLFSIAPAGPNKGLDGWSGSGA